MAGKIQLTPSELQSQATEMQNLETEYSALFAGVSSDLKSVNGNWSPNLSNNFEGKINSAQKSFTQITQELMNGSKVANTCAVTFESVDSELSKLYCSGDNGIESDQTILGAIKESLMQLPEEIKTVGQALDYLESKYGELPEDVKKYIEKALPSDLKEAYKHTSDILQGDLTIDNLYSVIKYIGGGSPKATSVIESIKYAIDVGAQKDAEMQEDIMAQLSEGDVGGAIFDMGEGFIDIIGGGVVKVGSELLSGITDKTINKIPLLNNFIKETTGKTAGDWISAGGDFLVDGIDTVTDVISDGVNVVTDSVVSGLKNVGSWIYNKFIK